MENGYVEPGHIQLSDECEFWECVLKSYDLITYDELLDDEKYFSHLDRWVDLNSNFAEVITKAKVHCKLFYKTYMPLKKCEFFTFQSCIRNYVNLNCPVIVPTPECEGLKKFYDECKEYYYK
ncbi:hypothetical protein evm_013335 [Chilo suppressalis]|nr:hypothetical protein evm_013335 [Chilo suppressalis]